MRDQLDLLNHSGGNEVIQRALKNKHKHQTAHHLFLQKQRKAHERKMAEVQSLKETLDQGIRIAKDVIEQEKDIIRQRVRDLHLERTEKLEENYLDTSQSAPQLSNYVDSTHGKPSSLSRSSTCSSISPTTSFIVSVPEQLSDKVKQAKSLSAFTAAKKEIKDYQEQIYAEKLRAIAIQKHLAQKRAKSVGSPLRVHLLRGDDLFSESPGSGRSRRVLFDDSVVGSDIDDNSSLQLSVK